jgi:integrase
VDAVCSLRYEDLRFGSDGEFRAILWPADTDKMSRESPLPVPLPQEARKAVEGILEARGPSSDSPYLFPCPSDPSEPVDYNSLYRFLGDAGDRADNLTLPDGFGFHSFRRMVVTELLEEGWSPKHVGQYVGMSPKMALEVYGKPTERSLNGMAEAL